MTTCKIEFYVVTDGNFGASRARGQCKTHNFDLSEYHLKGRETCPIGKIEEATEIALAQIEAAKK